MSHVQRHHRTFMRPVDNIARNIRTIYTLARGDRVRRIRTGVGHVAVWMCTQQTRWVAESNVVTCHTVIICYAFTEITETNYVKREYARSGLRSAFVTLCMTNTDHPQWSHATRCDLLSHDKTPSAMSPYQRNGLSESACRQCPR